MKEYSLQLSGDILDKAQAVQAYIQRFSPGYEFSLDEIVSSCVLIVYKEFGLDKEH